MNTWQYDLQADRLEDKQVGWNQPVKGFVQNTSVADLTVEKFNYLLRQLPLIQKLDDDAAKEQYLVDLSAALGQVYYVRIRINQLSDKLSNTEKVAQQEKLLTEYTDQIEELRSLIESEPKEA